jgi:hypothetical protein
MLALGSQLYELTQRDQTSLFVDPYFRTATVTIAATASTGTATFSFPKDSCIYLHSLVWAGNNAALANWTAMAVSITNAQGNAFRIFAAQGDGTSTLNGDNQAGGIGKAISIWRRHDLIIPPGTSSLSIGCTRADTTNAINFQVDVVAYLIPPGRIGRLS